MEENSVKLSQITQADVEQYLRIDESDTQIPSIMKAAIGFIMSHTGRTLEELDKYDDIWIVFMILCQDMYDNRSLYVEKACENKVVIDTLNRHIKDMIL